MAALALVSGSFALARLDARSVSALRSYHAEPGTGVPDEMMVTVSTDGKLFHVPGCRFLHKHENESVRLIAASEAIREGYAPCVRCLRQYLRISRQSSVVSLQPFLILCVLRGDFTVKGLDCDKTSRRSRAFLPQSEGIPLATSQ